MESFDPFTISLGGHNLIEASAGTGKTYSIASVFVRTLAEGKFTVDEILVVTYTKAAAGELRNRLLQRIQKAIAALKEGAAVEDAFLQQLVEKMPDRAKAVQRLEAAVRDFDQAAIDTIHAFCYRTLQEYAFESNILFDVELTGNDTAILQQLVDDFWRKWVAEATENPIKQPLIKYMLDNGYTPYSIGNQLFSHVGKPYLKVQSAVTEIPRLGGKLKKLVTAFEALNQEWNSSRSEIMKLLDSGSLRYYRSNWLKGWGLQMDKLLQSEVVPIQLFKQFTKFTQTTIEESTKENEEVPQHFFFVLAEEYQQCTATLNNYDTTFKALVYNYLTEKAGPAKEEFQQLSYDDVLTALRNALITIPQGERLCKILRKKYPLALVDEFQDTDPIQYQIFKTIYPPDSSKAALFMIGDPKQSIYGFRGADIFTYLQARNEVSGGRLFSLDHNYRSSPNLVQAVNHLFNYNSKPFVFDDISFLPVQAAISNNIPLQIENQKRAPIQIRHLSKDDEHESLLGTGEASQRAVKDTALQIQQLLQAASAGQATIAGKPVQASDIAILVREHNQADIIAEALLEKGIKSVQFSTQSVFHSREAQTLLYVLQAIAEPGEEKQIRAALASSFMNYKAKDLLALEENEQQWINCLEAFTRWHALWKEQGIVVMFKTLMEEKSIEQQLARQENGERKLTNYIHLIELLQEQENRKKSSPQQLLQWLRLQCNETEVQDTDQLRLESDEELVKIVTMHSSKGLEYPIVFCPFLWKFKKRDDKGEPIVYHAPHDPAKVYLYLGGKQDSKRDEKRLAEARENLAESMRLFYVAVSRAKYHCVMSWCDAKYADLSPLGYLLLGDRSKEALERLFGVGDKYEDPSKEVFDEALLKLENEEPDLIEISTGMEASQVQFYFQNDSAPLQEARTFKGELPLSRGLLISSFSSISRNKIDDPGERFEDYYEHSLYNEEAPEEQLKPSIYTFPKGPKPGTAIHYIFEQIDFSDAAGWKSIIRENLQKQSIDSSWTPVIFKMVERCLQKTLVPQVPGLSLEALNTSQYVSEMEFYFSSGNVQLSKLLSIIRPHDDIPAAIDGFAGKGFFKGFIDLVFEYNNRYYLLDYKTNHLGDTIGDYQHSYLDTEMKEALYDLQYHLYAVAVHRFLGKKLSDYSYDTHFGGALYLFVRGINENGSEGIFFDQPDPAIITKLNHYLERAEAR